MMQERKQMPPSVSIILVVKNELASLQKSIPIIEQQTYDGAIEYVCVDSGSTDGTVEFMRERGVEVHCIPPASFHHGRTRNRAASLAKHEILVYLSGDAIPTDHAWLRRLVEPFQDAAVGAAYGRQLAPDTIGPLRRYAMAYEYPTEPQVRELAAGMKPHLGLFRMSNANSAIRSGVWERFRFNETVVTSEDVGMCRDILMHGMKVVYVPEAAVYHCHEKSLWYEFQKAFDSGISLRRLGILGNPAYGSEFGYGWRRVRNDWAHFAGQKAYSCAVISLVVSGVKWAGVQIGKRGDSLPRWLTGRISAGIEKMTEEQSGLSGND